MTNQEAGIYMVFGTVFLVAMFIFFWDLLSRRQQRQQRQQKH